MKRCTACQAEKPLSEYYRNSSYKGGYQAQCKDCDNEATRIRRLLANEGKKRCGVCHEVQDIGEFRPDPSMTSGRANTCRDCRNHQVYWRKQDKKHAPINKLLREWLP